MVNLASFNIFVECGQSEKMYICNIGPGTNKITQESLYHEHQVEEKKYAQHIGDIM